MKKNNILYRVKINSLELRQTKAEIKSKFEKNNKNPRSLEPQSRTPKNRTNRKRISQEAEDKIIC